MTVFLIAATIGLLLGSNGLMLSWVLGGIAVAFTALMAMAFPPRPPEEIWLALAIGIAGYNLGLLIAAGLRFRRVIRAENEA